MGCLSFLETPDPGFLLPPALAWVVPWVFPQGGEALELLEDEFQGRSWAKAITPKGTALGCGVCPPVLPPPMGYFLSSCFAEPVARAGASARLGKIPHPM